MATRLGQSLSRLPSHTPKMNSQSSLPNRNDNSAYLIYIPSLIFVILLPLLVILRFWVRLRRHGKLGPDDWAAATAMIFTLLTCAVLVAACHNGMGRHFIYLTENEKYNTLRYFYTCQVFYKAAINISKVSIILLYLRIFGTVAWFNVVCWTLVACIAAYCLASVAATILQCLPIQKSFNKSLPGHCIDLARFWIANAAFSITTDVIILLLPMPLVLRLQVSLGQKIALVAIFAMGIFVVFTSCFRVTTLDIYAKTPDMSYDITNVMWTIIEPSTAVVCGNLPILRPALIGLLPSLGSKNSLGESDPAIALDSATASATTSAPRHIRHPTQDRIEWLQISRTKSDGVHAATIHRSQSMAGSEEEILGGRQSPIVIHKKMEYSVQFSGHERQEDV